MEDEYAKLIRRMNPPRVTIDNNSSPDATVIQVESVNKHGILLEVVQVLSDLDLVITKAYISSDGGWFMDVFSVTYRDGSKIRDEGVVNYIKEVLENDAFYVPTLSSSVGLKPSEDYTAIELVGTDRPGLLSEVSAVLTDLGCNVVNAEIWTHNARAAAVVHVTDEKTRCAVKDPKRLLTIKKLLCNVLKGNNDLKTAKMTLSAPGYMHRQRRLHQIMFAERDYENIERAEQEDRLRPQVTVLDCVEKDYTVITIHCRDRPKLLFDIICTLTDMEYVVFHGVVHTGKMEAFQEYYIRHVDGCPVSSEAERERVMQCLEAAIERMNARIIATVDSVKLICYSDATIIQVESVNKHGILLEVVQVLSDLDLVITEAYISSDGGASILGVFTEPMQCPYALGGKSIPNILLLIQERLYAQGVLQVCDLPCEDVGCKFGFGFPVELGSVIYVCPIVLQWRSGTASVHGMLGMGVIYICMVLV